MQVAPQAIHINTLKDRPTGVTDFFSKIAQNQGISAFMRGSSGLALNLATQHTIRFFTYDFFHDATKGLSSSQFMQTLMASTLSACLTSTASYPLDLVHARMAADMSSKATIFTPDSKQARNMAMGD